ncbi:MAG: restriction endonuclease subunit S [Peptococcaceae bacterium]|nr:restriction endonuclease subunit S [Peptococcaceae bacterium]
MPFAWEQRKAVDIFKTTADKGYPELPVLSATQDRGMILREDTGINIAHNKKNEATYKRVLPGQFVIHLRSFQGGFAHSNVEGITSPAYTVLDFIDKESHDDLFWKYIFSSRSFVKRLETVTYGIRDGRSISYDDFSEMSFLYPSSTEQKYIGEAFMSFDHLITLHQRTPRVSLWNRVGSAQPG